MSQNYGTGQNQGQYGSYNNYGSEFNSNFEPQYNRTQTRPGPNPHQTQKFAVEQTADYYGNNSQQLKQPRMGG